MKPLSEQAANTNPECYDLFVEWVQSSNDLKAALLQNAPDLLAAIRKSHAKLDAYIAHVRARVRESSRLTGEAARVPPQ